MNSDAKYIRELKKLEDDLPYQAIYKAWHEVLEFNEKKKVEEASPLLARCLNRL